MKRTCLMAAVFVLALAVAVFVAEAPASVLAAPDQGMLFDSPLAPPNDDFASATVIPGLRFSESANVMYATVEPHEPTPTCASDYGQIGRSIWYRFTPTESGMVMGAPSWAYWSVMAVYRGDALNTLSDVACQTSGYPTIFYAEAGTPYSIQIGSLYETYSYYFDFYLDTVGPPQAMFYYEPYDVFVSTPVRFRDESWDPAYIGIESREWDLGDGTTASGYYVEHQYTAVGNYKVSLTITTTDGRTASTSQQVSVGVPPPPSASFYVSHQEPSIYDTISFWSYSWDPAYIGIESYTWNMGDGTTATGEHVQHRYAADGDYTVQLSVTTKDGRTASTSQQVKVITRDVAITKFSTPQAAKAGQTRQLSVGIVNKSYEDWVRVDLYRSIPAACDYGWCQTYVNMGRYSQFVSIRSGNRTTDFSFHYTFTTEDASIGKVTFKAVATIVDGPGDEANPLRDALPADNEAISSPTKVNP